MTYLLLALLMLAWALAESSRAETSRGLISMFLGAMVLAVGAANVGDYDRFFCWFAIAAGLFIALFGTARFIIYELRHS